MSYLRRFILAEVSSPLHKLLKKKVSFQWEEQQHETFNKIKRVLASPNVMILPSPRKLLKLYLGTTERSIGALLVQDNDGIERPVYYLSRLIKGAEHNYTELEKQCLGLTFVAQ